jgi:type I restriction enzyme M protein
MIKEDRGVQARIAALRHALSLWWTAHSPRITELPTRRNLNAVRAEVLESFVAALLDIGVLDRFKLAGVIARWWNDTIPDFKTLLENGFSGVIDGWVDAIADAVQDDDAAGPRMVRKRQTTKPFWAHYRDCRLEPHDRLCLD